ncbi:PTS transporter subunit EIIB [Mycoplasmopsis caviae]|uniref:PTS transporter subunit EIIB n=1 Tax=Mycoplasmopsis caviae TaxID=55603 RepID=A0A3P8LAA9_9BACT|nr:PTS transporter subunit EIIB [Mycoplasmopsis caviae]UUD35683.1 PTS transporter subunit EIIB [Mycoplasmopsis caviae]VDR41571.1 putative PTS system glucose-specific enzyme II [Mycoplasmopsis caviae]
MSKKDKFLVVLLTIVTFGFCWVYWRTRNRKELKLKREGTNIKLPSNIKIVELVDNLGGKENIEEVSASISNIKVLIKNKSLVKMEELQSTKFITGIMISTNKISLVVGDYARKLAIELNEYLDK